MPKHLDEEQKAALSVWLTKNHIDLGKNCREYSDGVLVANFLKSLYPKYVELHNYPPANAFKLKLSNWETLNLKVLKKLNKPQKRKTLENLANGLPEAIERLFFDIMMLETDEVLEDKEKKEPQPSFTEDDTIIVNVNKVIGDAIIQMPQKMIKYESYRKVLNENKGKSEKLAELEMQIADMELLVKEKSAEIDMLCNRLAQETVTNLMHECKSSDTDE